MVTDAARTAFDERVMRLREDRHVFRVVGRRAPRAASRGVDTPRSPCALDPSSVRSREESAMHVRIYVKEWCPHCAGAKHLLDEKGIRYEEIDVERDPARRAEMLRLCDSRKTVPQIFFGERHIGGYDDLREIDRVQGLRTLLPDESRWAPEP
jgi:glutaredoxin 3